MRQGLLNDAAFAFDWRDNDDGGAIEVEVLGKAGDGHDARTKGAGEFVCQFPKLDVAIGSNRAESRDARAHGRVQSRVDRMSG